MELWDIYDKDGKKTGRVQMRGSPQNPGDYHLAVVVAVVNNRGEILCTRRSPEKDLCPGMWENPGGGVQAGEDSLTGAIRELREETGLRAAPEELKFLYRDKRPDFFMDVYGLHRDIPLESLVLQPEETCDAAWVPYDTWEKRARVAEILSPAGPKNEEFFSILRSFL